MRISDCSSDVCSSDLNIDIGGPAMVRSSAKNHAFVNIVTEPEDYAALIEEMDANGGATTLALRKRLAATAFAPPARSEERRVGKECVRRWRSRRSPKP